MIKKPKLILISGTDARLVDFERNGFFNRQKKLITEYSKYFDIEYYTCDARNYSAKLNIKHYSLPLKTSIYGFRHLLFWLYLVSRARFMKATIRVFGVAIPTLPLVKLLSGQKVIIGYQWDYASVTKANYRGIKRWLASNLQNSGFKAADFVICTTGQLRKIAEDRYNKQAVVIPNFVDTEMFHKEDSKEKFILFAGRIHWAKGIEYLIKAYGQIKNEFANSALIICGNTGYDPNYFAKLKQIVKENHIHNVQFAGVVNQDNLARLMGKAKAFVLPTVNHEGHPKVLIEAMASGTACIATDVPGNRDVITHRANGLLVSPMNSNKLYQALALLYTDEKLRMRLEQNAHLFSVENYSIDKTLLKEIQLIKHWTQENQSG